MSVPPDKRDEALSAIKEILKRAGRPLSTDEAIEFINRPVLLVRGADKPGKRGPKRRRNQYDDAFDRRRGLYHRLVRLPAARRATAKPLQSRVERIAKEAIANGIVGRKLTSAVAWRLQLEGFAHDRTTVMRVLKALHFLK